ncbi:Similar to Cyp9f2: Probable cytochrome P450 9f2 (Drosophila melanogaster) [Cotesia congregata]|uniref:Similar to Cyp9f2: Probable cytochrome P450 9f2 (Drosophila melanogaster) n=1 Tax=Cotesia congregata TaxID=51543 RepID=A0A8J2MLB8_COTCN|nr:Similar to Cyp9f2: Probable cytochrome P450 9f2 (Drosophila melanogaster) [Cotesia congregata]
MYLILTIACVFVTYFLFFRKNYFAKLGIPYKTPLPVLGNMWKVIFRRSTGVDVITEIYNCNSEAKYVGIFEFSVPVLMIKDLELIKDITVKHFDHFVDHRAFMDRSFHP